MLLKPYFVFGKIWRHVYFAQERILCPENTHISRVNMEKIKDHASLHNGMQDGRYIKERGEGERISWYGGRHRKAKKRRLLGSLISN